MSKIYRAADLLAKIRKDYHNTIAALNLQTHNGVEYISVDIEVEPFRRMADAFSAAVTTGDWIESVTPGTRQRSLTCKIDGLDVRAIEVSDV